MRARVVGGLLGTLTVVGCCGGYGTIARSATGSNGSGKGSSGYGSRTPRVVYTAEEATRAAEMEANAFRMLAERIGDVRQSVVERKVSSAEVAMTALDKELAKVVVREDSVLVRVGIATAALSVTAGVFLKKHGADHEGDNEGWGVESLLASWISSSSSSMTFSFLAATSVALAALWRDQNGRDLLHSAQSSILSLFRLIRREDQRTKHNAAVEKSFQETCELDKTAKHLLGVYRNSQKTQFDQEATKAILRSYEVRMQDADSAITKAADLVHLFRLQETAIDLEREANEVRHNAIRLRERDRERPLWDFLVAVTAVLCGGASPLAGVVAWAASVPFASMVLRFTNYDSSAAITHLRKRKAKLDHLLRTSRDHPAP